AGVHPLGAHGEPMLVGQRREAEVAEDAAGVELVEPLADERRAAAAAAARPRRAQRADPARHQDRGEVGHPDPFSRGRRCPSPTHPSWKTHPPDGYATCDRFRTQTTQIAKKGRTVVPGLVTMR